MLATLSVFIAVLLDRCFGEPGRWHPLNGFAALACRLESMLNVPGTGMVGLRLRGMLAVFILLLPAILLSAWLGRQGFGGWLFSVAVLYLAIAWHSLIEHADAVAHALSAGDIEAARDRTGRIVGRDTTALDEVQVSRATLESVLENGNDAIFGAIFWFLIAGPAGAIGYRLANTLDALWGYRNERYRDFGWAAARLDDLLNFLPARLTALSYLLCGGALKWLAVVAQQASQWPSRNAGWVMATGAAALKRQLGGHVSYQGVRHERPVLGCGTPPGLADIGRGLDLLRNTLLLWLAVMLAGSWVLGYGHA